MDEMTRKLYLVPEEEEQFKKDWDRVTGLWKRSGIDLGKIPLVAYDTCGKRYA